MGNALHRAFDLDIIAPSGSTKVMVVTEDGFQFAYSTVEAIQAPLDVAGLATDADIADLQSQIGVSGSYASQDKYYATNNGGGQNFKVGDDLWIGDVNLANTMQVSGAQNSGSGYIKFGSGSTSPKIGTNGNGKLAVSASMVFAGSSDEQTSAYAGGVGHMMMVDTNRTDTYTELGTTDKPFKTLSAAISAANTANPTGTEPYTFVMMGCNIDENIDFGGTAFNFITLATSCRTVINGTLTIANNPNLKQLIIRNLEFAQSVTITGDGTADQMNDLSFYNTSFADTLNVTCANSLALWDVYSSAAVNLTNLNYLYVGGGQITGDVTIVADSTETLPANGMAPGQAIVFDLVCNNLTFTRGGAASYVFQPHNTRIGLNAGSYTIPSGFTVSAQATTFRGTWTNNGSLTMRNSSTDNLISGTPATYTGVLGGSYVALQTVATLPASAHTGSIAVSGSGADCKPYFFNGSTWASLI
jgi:hypothetical protein